MGESVGAIYYEVDADTAKLLEKVPQVEKVTDKLGKTFEKTGKAANDAEFKLRQTAAAASLLAKDAQTAQSNLGGLTKLLGGIVTLQGASALIKMAEAYGEMSERVRMAVRSQEEYDLVQQRLLATSNGTYRALSESQEIFISTGDNLRDMGYSLEQALDVTDSLSYSFVANATAADKAQNAMRAYDMALNKGKVEADGWLTIVAAVPTVVNDIAAATGKTTQQIREMGASGQLTASMLNEGLRTSLDKNKAAADGMATTVKDAFVALNNNLSAYVGEANKSSGATAMMSKAVMLLGQNIDTVVKLLMVVGAGALAKYIAMTGAAVVSSAQAAIAARAQAAQELALAQAHVTSTAAAAAHAAANVGLMGAAGAAATAANAHTAALVAEAAAQRAATAAGVGLLGILGGPAGIIALVGAAAAGIYLFGSNSAGAAPKVDQLTDSIDKLTVAQLANRRLQAADAIEQLTKKAQEANASVKALEKDQAALNEQLKAGRGGITTEGMDNVNASLVEARANADSATQELQQAINADYKLADAQKQRDAAAKAGRGAAPKPQQDPEVRKRLESMRQELELAKLTGAAKAKLQAIQKLGNNATAEEKAEAEKLAAEIFRLEEAKSKSASASKKSADEAANSAKENAKAISTMRAEVEQAALSGDKLAEAKARAKLNKFATPEEVQTMKQLAQELTNIEDAKKNAEVIQDLGRQYALAGLNGLELAKANAVLRLNPAATEEDIRLVTQFTEAIWRAQQVQSMGSNVGLYVRGDVKPLSGGAFDDQAARYEAEAVAEEERYAAQLERLQLAIDAQAMTLQEGFDQQEGIYQTHVDRMNQIDRARTSVMMNAYSDGFGAVADILKNAQGEQSSAYKAMFAVSKAFAVADTAVQVYGAVAKAWNSAPFPVNLPAVAAATAGAVPLIAKVGAVSMGGGRQYGGPVAQGGMYRINETGAPEVLNMANGKQFLLPNGRGEVVSNKDATASGKDGGSVPHITVNLIEDASRGGQVDQQQVNDQTILTVVVASIRKGGEVAGAMEGTYGVTRRGR